MNTKIAVGFGVLALLLERSAFAQVQVIENPQALTPLQSAQMGQQFMAPINDAIIRNGENQVNFARMRAEQAFEAQQQRQRLDAEAAAQRRQLDDSEAVQKLTAQAWKDVSIAHELAITKQQEAVAMAEANKYKILNGRTAIEQGGFRAGLWNYLSPPPLPYAAPYKISKL